MQLPLTCDHAIVDDLQVRCLAYNLLRKYPIIQGGVTHDTLEDVQATAIKWARLLGLDPELAEAAFDAWKRFF